MWRGVLLLQEMADLAAVRLQQVHNASVACRCGVVPNLSYYYYYIL
jgi:hypothetical protein